MFKHHNENVWRLALRDDVYASASNDGTVEVRNHRTGGPVMTFSTVSKEGDKKQRGVMGVAFTGDGRIVYTGISDESAPLMSRPVIVANPKVN